jgi:hypothetical protein
MKRRGMSRLDGALRGEPLHPRNVSAGNVLEKERRQIVERFGARDSDHREAAVGRE